MKIKYSMKPSFYFKTIPWIIRNHNVTEFIKLRKSKNDDKKKRKRKEEYFKIACSNKEALDRLFPGSSIQNELLLKDMDEKISDFIRIRQNMKQDTIENPYPIDAGLDLRTLHFLFHLCYLTNPEKIVETGVANGFSSSYILLALSKLSNGNLISIDRLYLPWHTKENVGLAIPQELKKYHKLLFGKGEEELKNIEKIDIFIHDSAHVYDHMMNEFNIGWSKLNSGGFLCSDDASENDAFLDFSESHNITPVIITKQNNRHFGIIQKQ